MSRKNNTIEKIDKFIGTMVYATRLEQGVSRQQLAKAAEVTQQQIYKYETGIDRISVGRLVLLAKALKKGIDYFYIGIASDGSELITTEHQRLCIEISNNFMKIPNSQQQKAVSILVRSLAREYDELLPF